MNSTIDDKVEAARALSGKYAKRGTLIIITGGMAAFALIISLRTPTGNSLGLVIFGIAAIMGSAYAFISYGVHLALPEYLSDRTDIYVRFGGVIHLITGGVILTIGLELAQNLHLIH